MRVGMVALLSALLSGRGGTAGNAGRVVGNQVPEVSTSVIASQLTSGGFSTYLGEVFSDMRKARGEKRFNQRKMELIASIYEKCDISTYDKDAISREVRDAMEKDEEFLVSLNNILSWRDDVDERTKAQFSGNIFSIDGIYDIETREMQLLGEIISKGSKLGDPVGETEWESNLRKWRQQSLVQSQGSYNCNDALWDLIGELKGGWGYLLYVSEVFGSNERYMEYVNDYIKSYRVKKELDNESFSSEKGSMLIDDNKQKGTVIDALTRQFRKRSEKENVIEALRGKEVDEHRYKDFLEKIRVLANIYEKCEESTNVGKNLDPSARIFVLADGVQKRLHESVDPEEFENTSLEKLKLVDEMLDIVKSSESSCIKFERSDERDACVRLWVERAARTEDSSVLEIVRDEAKKYGKDVSMSDLETMYALFSVEQVKSRVRGHDLMTANLSGKLHRDDDLRKYLTEPPEPQDESEEYYGGYQSESEEYSGGPQGESEEYSGRRKSWINDYEGFSEYVYEYVKKRGDSNAKLFGYDEHEINCGVSAKKLRLLLKIYMDEKRSILRIDTSEYEDWTVREIIFAALDSDLEFLEFVDEIAEKWYGLEGAYPVPLRRLYLLEHLLSNDRFRLVPVKALNPDRMRAVWNILKSVDPNEITAGNCQSLTYLIRAVWKAVYMGLDLTEGVADEAGYVDKYNDFGFFLGDEDYQYYADRCTRLIEACRNGELSDEEYDYYLRRIGLTGEDEDRDIIKRRVENEIGKDIKKILSICAECKDYRDSFYRPLNGYARDFFDMLLDDLRCRDFECLEFLYNISRKFYVFGSCEFRPNIVWLRRIVEIHQKCSRNLGEDFKGRILKNIESVLEMAAERIIRRDRIAGLDTKKVSGNLQAGDNEKEKYGPIRSGPKEMVDRVCEAIDKIVSDASIELAEAADRGEIAVEEVRDKASKRIVVLERRIAINRINAEYNLCIDFIKAGCYELRVGSEDDRRRHWDELKEYLDDLKEQKNLGCLMYLRDISNMLRTFGSEGGCMLRIGQIRDIADIYKYCCDNLGRKDVVIEAVKSIKDLLNEAGGLKCVPKMDYGLTNATEERRLVDVMRHHMRLQARNLVDEGINRIKECIGHKDLTVENIKMITKEIEEKRVENPVPSEPDGELLRFCLRRYGPGLRPLNFLNYEYASHILGRAFGLMRSGRKDIMGVHMSKEVAGKSLESPLDREIKVQSGDYRQARIAKTGEICKTLLELERKTGITEGVYTGDARDALNSTTYSASKYYRDKFREYEGRVSGSMIDDMFRSVKWLDRQDVEVWLGSDLGEETAKLAREYIETTSIDCEKIKSDSKFGDEIEKIINIVPEQDRHFGNVGNEKVDEFLNHLHRALGKELEGLLKSIIDLEKAEVGTEKEKKMSERYGRLKLAQEKAECLMAWREWLKKGKYERLSVPLSVLKSVFGELFDKERVVPGGKTLLFEKEEFKEIRNKIEAAMLVYESVCKYSSHNGHCLIRAKELVDGVKSDIDKFLLYSNGFESVSERDKVFALIKEKMFELAKEKVLNDISTKVRDPRRDRLDRLRNYNEFKGEVYSLGLADGSPLDIISGEFGRGIESVNVGYKVRENVEKIIESGCDIPINKFVDLVNSILQDFSEEDRMRLGYFGVTREGRFIVEGSYKAELTFDEYCDYTGKAAGEKEEFKNRVLEGLKEWGESDLGDDYESFRNWLNGNRKLSLGLVKIILGYFGIDADHDNGALAFVVSAIKEGLLKKKISQ